MEKPHICAVLTNGNIGSVRSAEPLADLFEVRIDMIGKEWQNVAKEITKPWIATNRMKSEGGMWEGSEDDRRKELLKALRLGANMVDIELSTPDIEEIIPIIKKKAGCIISHHDMRRTPPDAELHRIIEDELAQGADICKLATTARSFEDNARILGIIRDFRPVNIIAFAMGTRGQASRILSPLCGGRFTYASTGEDQKSAPGQITLSQMRNILGMMDT
jgi:3-dehydroquinate dehydratase type I